MKRRIGSVKSACAGVPGNYFSALKVTASKTISRAGTRTCWELGLCCDNYFATCPGDFNGDGQVDDSDFVLFAGYYDLLLDARGDLNGDGQTDDSDFVIFAGAYDALLCS